MRFMPYVLSLFSAVAVSCREIPPASIERTEGDRFVTYTDRRNPSVTHVYTDSLKDGTIDWRFRESSSLSYSTHTTEIVDGDPPERDAMYDFGSRTFRKVGRNSESGRLHQSDFEKVKAAYERQ